MRTKSNSEHPLRELSKEEIAELFANLEPIELPDGPRSSAALCSGRSIGASCGHLLTCQKFNCICIVEIISCGSHFFLGVFPCFFGICRQLSAFRCF